MPTLSNRRRAAIAAGTGSALDYAVRLVHHVCCIAGSASFIEDLRGDLQARGVVQALRDRKSAPVFDWLVERLSYQGIANRVAYDYIQRHGRITWRQIDSNLRRAPPCPKLQSYWAFSGCRYHKTSQTCAEPQHIDDCPLPQHDLRNGHLNQSAYALFLFIRELTGTDLVSWIDRQLMTAIDDPTAADRSAAMTEALLGPLRQVYGVSDKVLAMSLSMLLLAAPAEWPHWREVGANLIAVDTLVHNFLHRTGILARFNAQHTYGAGCYRPGGCASIIRKIAQLVDAQLFNSQFPRVFPRFVQHAIWRYCAASELNVCNGNRIDDQLSCNNIYCRLYSHCDRISLYIS